MNHNHISSYYLFLIIPIAALIPLLASLTIFFRPATQTYLKYFSLFLLINCLMDAVTSYMAWHTVNNIFLNNVDSVVIITFQIYILREIIGNRRAKKIFLFALLAYPILATINILLVQTSGVFHTITYCFGSLMIVTACIYYFWELFQQKYSVNLVRQPAFWICSGLLFYYACTFPIYGMTKLLEALPQVILRNLFSILIIVNIFLYLSFTIAYLCRLKMKKSM